MKISTRLFAFATTLMLFGSGALAQPTGDWQRSLLLTQGNQIRIQTDEAGAFSVHAGMLLLEDAELVRSGDSLRVTDSEGRVLLDLECTEDGRLIMPPGATLTVPPQPGKRAVIGIRMVNLSEALAFQLDLEPTSGLLVSEVIEGYPAEQAGLEKHDVIIRADGQPLDTDLTLRSVLIGKREGEEVVLTVIRGGRHLDVSIPVREEEVQGGYLPGAALSNRFDTNSLFYDWTFLEEGGVLGFGPEAGHNSIRKRLFSFIEPRELREPREPREPQDDASSLADLNQRLERLERLLEKLVDKK